MTLHLYNSLTKNVEPISPLAANTLRIYSCGPTVYDHVHIGNLSAFIVADTIRRVASTTFDVHHAMNFTDVDDKTIKKSQIEYPELPAREALAKSTAHYTDLFMRDLARIGNDLDAYTFVKATDEKTIDGMRTLISELLEKGYAYIADDGIYFSIDAYRKSGKTYGQLIELTKSNTSAGRIQNDEYDKESAHDFALWKKQKPGEPAWDFMVNDTDMTGRPGWHIECSVMSANTLGVPFDIHTGGIDLQFPHHENEIAQSTAGNQSSVYAATFVHNEHILVDGKKMSKSLGNFFTLADITDKGVDPLAFRLLVLQSHYRKATNFSLENATACTNRLKHWRAYASLRWQVPDTIETNASASELIAAKNALLNALSNDLDTPTALSQIDELFAKLDTFTLSQIDRSALLGFLETIDHTLGLQLLSSTPDVDEEIKHSLWRREEARNAKDWATSDRLRDDLLARGIAVRDTPSGQIWQYA